MFFLQDIILLLSDLPPRPPKVKPAASQWVGITLPKMSNLIQSIKVRGEIFVFNYKVTLVKSLELVAVNCMVQVSEGKNQLSFLHATLPLNSISVRVRILILLHEWKPTDVCTVYLHRPLYCPYCVWQYGVLLLIPIFRMKWGDTLSVGVKDTSLCYRVSNTWNKCIYCACSQIWSLVFVHILGGTIHGT